MAADKTLGDLIFDLVIDDSKFQATIDSSIKKIRSLNSAFASVARNAAKASAGGTGGGGATEPTEQSRSSAIKQLLAFGRMVKQAQAESDAAVRKEEANEQKRRMLFGSRLTAYGKMLAQETVKRDAALRSQEVAEQKTRMMFSGRLASYGKMIQREVAAVAKAEEAKRKEEAKTAAAAIAALAKQEAARKKADAAALKAIKDRTDAQESVFKTLGSAGTDVASTIMSAFKIATTAVAAVGTAITVLGAKFEQTINTVSVLSDGSLPELTKAARQFGMESKFSAQEAADAMLNFAQAGMTAEQNIAATGAAIKLAAASGSDLTLTTSIMSDAISQFSLSTNDASNLADIFTYALNDSKLGMEDLSVSMRYAGTVGAGFGMSVQETTAALMMFSSLGLKGSKAGTVFRQTMNAAANTTREAEKALAAYGLTQADISPLTKKFGEILNTVADAGITVDDALKIFGTTAGANVVALAKMQKESAGTAKSFESLVAGMDAAISRGDAAIKATQMMDNVAGQFTLLIARLREIGLSIYDAYSGPLKAIITEAGGVASDIISVFGYASTSISEGVGGALSDLASYIRDNRAQIVGMVVAFIEGFSRLTAQILSLMPTFAGLVSIALDFGNAIFTVGDAVAALIPGVTNAAGVFATLFLVGEALAFVAAISKISAAIRDLQKALVGAEMSAAAATGGLTALVMIGGMLVGWLAQYVTANDEAAASVDRLRAAEEHRKLVNDKAYAAEVARVSKLLDASKAQAQEALKNGKTLTDEQRRQAEATLRLTKEQALLEMQSGRLVAIKGRLATVSEVAAMASKGESAALQTMYREQAKEEAAAADQLERLRRAKADADKGFKTAVRGSFIPGAPSQEDVRQNLAQTGGGQVQSYEELTLAIADAEKALERIQGRDEAFRNELFLAQHAVDKTTGSMKKLQGPTKEAAKATDELAAAMRGLIADAQKRYDEVLKAFEEANTSEGELQAKRLEEQIATDNATYQAAAIAAAKLNDASVDWEKRRLESEKMVRAVYRKGLLDESKAFLEKEVAEANNAIWDEAERRAAGRQKEIEAILAFYREKLAAAANDADATKQLLDDRDAALDAAGAKFRAEDLAAEEDYQARLSEIRKTAAERLGNEVNTIEEAKLSASEKIRKDANDKVKGIIDDGVKAYREANKDREVSDLEAFTYALSLLQQNKEAVGAIFEDADKRAREAATPYEKLRATFVKVFGEGAGKSLDDLKKKLEETGGTAKRIAGIIGKAFGGAFKGIKAGFDAIMGVVQSISGFSLNILGTIQQAVGEATQAQDAAMADAGERAKAAGFDPNVAARRAANTIDGGVIATQFVEGLFANALRMTEFFLAAVGPTLAALAAGLPDLFTAVADALPGIATALAQNIGPVIQAIVDGVPKVAIALIQSLPTIVTALVQAIYTELIPQLPIIAFELMKAIALAFWEIVGDLAKMLWDALRGRGGKEDTGNAAAYSGIDYVPSTMRATLHQGEAVIPADRNARRMRGATAPAPAGADQNYGGRSGGGNGPVEVSVIAEGRLLEAVQLRAQDMGRATGMSKRIRKAAGVQVGFSRGQFNPWSY